MMWHFRRPGFQLLVWSIGVALLASCWLPATIPSTPSPPAPINQPAAVTIEHGGLSFNIRTGKSSYLAGEAGLAEVTIHNESSETFMIRGEGLHFAQIVLLDERGDEPALWPWPPAPMSLPVKDQALAPGQAISDTLMFQLPPLEQAADHTYLLWAETRFSSTSSNGQVPDNIWRRLESGPIPLQVLAPAPSQQLQARLEADQSGWRLQLIDAGGQTPAGPFWGQLEAASSGSFIGRPLWDTATGTWSGDWDALRREREAAISVRAWVTVPGYVTAAITQTVPGTDDPGSMFGTSSPPQDRIYPSLTAARPMVAVPLYQPGQLPAGALLEMVRVKPTGASLNVEHVYRLPTGVWLRLTQIALARDEAAGWGQARYDPDAQIVQVGQTMGYLIQHLGWWVLDWKVGNMSFDLRMPVSVVSAEDLRNTAASVEPVQ